MIYWKLYKTDNDDFKSVVEYNNSPLVFYGVSNGGGRYAPWSNIITEYHNDVHNILHKREIFFDILWHREMLNNDFGKFVATEFLYD